MKKLFLLFTYILLITNMSFSQSTGKTLDYVQTKDGKKYYGKITEMKPNEGITIQTYGDGNVITLKNNDIETVKFGAITDTKNDSIKKGERFYHTSVDIAHINPFIKRTPTNDMLFSAPNNFDFKRVGIHLTPTWTVAGKNSFGMLIGYEQGKNFDNIVLGSSIKIGRKINNSNNIYFNTMAALFYCFSQNGDFTDNYSGKYHNKQNYYGTGGSFGLGLGYLHKFKNLNSFIDITYRFENYQYAYYKYSSYFNEFVYEQGSLNCRAMQLRAGIMF